MKKHYTGPRIVAKPVAADVIISQGKTMPEVCREVEISQQTYCRCHLSASACFLMLVAMLN